MAKIDLDKSFKKHGDYLISILQDIQEFYQYLPEEVLREVSEKMGVPLIDIYGVATFYQSFSLSPKGEHVITACLGTACYVRGGTKIVDALSRDLNIKVGETTSDAKFTLETVNCLGCCAIGPILVIDGEYYGEMTPKKALDLLKSIKEGKKCSSPDLERNLKILQ